MSALFHRVIMTASGKVDFSEAARNRKAMANVTNSGAVGGPAVAKETAASTHAELEKQLVRRAQAGDPLAHVPRATLVDAITALFVHGLLSTAGATEDAASRATH